MTSANNTSISEKPAVPPAARPPQSASINHTTTSSLHATPSLALPRSSGNVVNLHRRAEHGGGNRTDHHPKHNDRDRRHQSDQFRGGRLEVAAQDVARLQQH